MLIKAGNANKRLDRPFSLKSLTDDGSFSGYGSVFGVLDSHEDIVAPGAFKRTLVEHQRAGTLPKMLWQHDACCPIGIYTTMREDANGLYVEGQLCLDTQMGKEAYALLKMGAIGGLSIGYRTVGSTYDSKLDVRTLTDVDLWEVSLVTFAACPDAQVSTVKGSALTERDFERHLTQDAGFTRTEARIIINNGFKALKTTQDAGLGGNKSLCDLIAETTAVLTNHTEK